jgi:ubiquinone/menaquinone biosynthesis C-methylase UbiE
MSGVNGARGANGADDVDGAPTTGFDAEEHRRRSLESWESAAVGWARWQPLMREFAKPVAAWMVDALQLRERATVLDVAAGPGDAGLLAAQRVAPGGGVIVSDQAEAMLDAARSRARELGIENAEFKQMNAESLDLPTARLDGVLCRWGLMLMVDPPAALSEFRRVLRPGGRLALAVWDGPARNPWASELAIVLAQRGLMTIPDQAAGHRPGMFALADPDRLADLIRDAGFLDVEVSTLELTRRHASFAELWESTLDMSSGFHDAVMSSAPGEIEAIERALAERLAPFAAADGTLSIPAATLVAKAEA